MMVRKTCVVASRPFVPLMHAGMVLHSGSGSAFMQSVLCMFLYAHVNHSHTQFGMQTAMHEVFEEDDMRQIFRWLQKFLNNPYSEDDQLVPAGIHDNHNKDATW